MTMHFRRLITGSVIAAAVMSAAANGQQRLEPTTKAPAIPANLEVPSGNVPYIKAFAVGTQNYVCKPSESGFAWTPFGPQATLFITFKWINGDIQQQVMTHFLSFNPVEGGVARPTWQSSLDTSSVWARVMESSIDPNFVAPGAVAWLLLEVVGTRPGPAGGATLTQTTYIQRLNTSGGMSPATGCSQSSNAGSTVLVPYTTDYFFYKASAEK